MLDHFQKKKQWDVENEMKNRFSCYDDFKEFKKISGVLSRMK